MTLLLLVLSSLASAKDLAPGSLPLTQVGAVADLKGCEMRVLANPWSAGAAVKVVIGEAEAQRICAEAQGDLTVAFATAWAKVIRAPAEAWLISDLGLTARAGGNMRIKTDELEAEAGDHLNWQAYAVTVASADPRLRLGGVGYIGGGDPNLYRLAGGQMGNVVTPAFPGSSSNATADCGTLTECDALAKKQAALLASQARAK